MRAAPYDNFFWFSFGALVGVALVAVVAIIAEHPELLQQ